MSVPNSITAPQDKVAIIREQAIIQLKSLLVDSRAPGKLARMTVSQGEADNYLVRAKFIARECPNGAEYAMDLTFSMRARITYLKGGR